MNDAFDRDQTADPEAALREARRHFIDTFPQRCEIIDTLLAQDSSAGAPSAPVRQIVHRIAGMAGMVGFATVSARAQEFEALIDAAGHGRPDPTAAEAALRRLREAFSRDLSAPPPAWDRPV